MSVGGVGGGGGMAAVQTELLSKVLQDSQSQMQALMKSMVSVDVQNQLASGKMGIAADIINAYGGSIDVMA